MDLQNYSSLMTESFCSLTNISWFPPPLAVIILHYFYEFEFFRLQMWDSAVCVGFPCDSAGKESACNGRDLGLISRLRWLPGEGKGSTPVFWPGEIHGLYIPWGCKELDMNDQLSLSAYFISSCLQSQMTAFFFLFKGWVTFRCRYNHISFIHSSTLRLFLYLGYCK